MSQSAELAGPPRAAGLYVVTLNNEMPISVNAHDRRQADLCIKVTRANCKFGKAKDLSWRKRDYDRTFQVENVNFRPLVLCEDIMVVECEMKRRLVEFRIVGRRGRRTEWLEGIDASHVEGLLWEVLAELGVAHQRL